MRKGKTVRRSPEKSELLQAQRGVSFEEVAALIDVGQDLVVVEHPSRVNQQLLLVRLHGYVHVVPFVLNDTEMRLKTIFPDRRYTNIYFDKLISE